MSGASQNNVCRVLSVVVVVAVIIRLFHRIVSRRFPYAHLIVLPLRLIVAYFKANPRASFSQAKTLPNS